MAEDEVLEEFLTKYQDAAECAVSGHVTYLPINYFLPFDKFKYFKLVIKYLFKPRVYQLERS